MQQQQLCRRPACGTALPRHARRRPRCTRSSSAGALVAGLPTPPPAYDYKADILPETLEVVTQHYPQLLPLVEQGNLVVHRRPASYSERRADGYREPRLVFLLGTAHVSQAAAAEVEAVVAAVRPQCVVVELCRSRAGVLAGAEQEQSAEQQQQQQQQGQQLAAAVAGASAADAGSSSFQEVALDAAAARLASNSQATSSSSGSSSSGGGWGTRRRATTMSLSGSSFLSAAARSAQLGGQSAMLLRLLIANQAQRAAEQLQVAPGGEFRAAARAAEAVGASLVLGDRPIEITLSRAWDALSWGRRGALLSDLALSALAGPPQALDAAAVEALRDDDAIASFADALSHRYPELVAPLVAERDLYLAWSVKRSKAVNGTDAVVGVLGKGHLRGVVYALRHDAGGLRFRDLVGTPAGGRRAAAAGALRRLGLELLLGAALFAAWAAAHGGLAGWP